MPSYVTTDRFTAAYLEAAEWTDAGPDSDIPEGADLSPEAIVQARIECEAFQSANVHTLALAGTPEQNGHDFWLTRNGHGAGFWDRGYPFTVGKVLTDAAEAAGSRSLYLGDDGLLYFGEG